MAAEVLATAGASVTVVDHMASVGRKLLLAGRGGLNLTHSEPIDALLARYGRARPRLEAAISAFGPSELRAWSAGLGSPTFVGSSGRVFPADFRATPLLRAWLRRLDELGVEIVVRQEWNGWRADPVAGLLVDFTGRDAAGSTIAADALVLATGGASWPRVGSDGAWVDVAASHGVEVTPLRPANCGFTVAWSEVFGERFAGTPVKTLAVQFGPAVARGEAMITSTGIEGGVIYELSAALRDAIEARGPVELLLDLQPDLSVEAIEALLGRRRPKESLSTSLRRLVRLQPVAIGLLREATSNRLPTDTAGLARLIKSAPIRVVSPQPIARAISTAGGVALAEVDDAFMLTSQPGVFVAGEMLDWEAPTGGYLLQATFSTAVAAAQGAVDWLAGRSAA